MRGEPAYFWSLFADSGHRTHRIRTGWKAVSRVFVLAIAMDIVHQIIALHLVYPGEALLVADGLESAAAKAFLEEMPSAAQLVPVVSVEDVQKQLPGISDSEDGG